MNRKYYRTQTEQKVRHIMEMGNRKEKFEKIGNILHKTVEIWK